MATKKVSKKSNNKEAVQEVVDKLLSLMGTSSQAEILEDKENKAFVINIKTNEEETGLLIGRRGETISSLQAIVSLIVRQRLGDWERIVVNIADWREKEEERLKAIAESAKERAKETGQPQPLYNLTPGQRRVIHLFLGEDPEVLTESIGEGEERYLVIKAK